MSGSISYLSCEHILIMRLSVWDFSYSTGSIQVSHPIYISICFATWLIASCYKQLEPNNNLFRSCRSSHYYETCGTSFGPFSTRCTPAVLCAFRSELLFSHTFPKVSGCYPQIPSAWAVLGEDLEVSCNPFSLSWQQSSLLCPLVFFCESIWLGSRQVWESGREIQGLVLFFFSFSTEKRWHGQWRNHYTGHEDAITFKKKMEFLSISTFL